MEKNEKDCEMAKIVVEEKSEEQDQLSEGEETTEISNTVLSGDDPTYMNDIISSSDLTSDDSYHTLCGEESDLSPGKEPITTKRVRKPVERYGISNLCVVDELGSRDEDITYEEATTGPESEMWKQAMKEELQAFEENQAWEIVSDKEADRVIKVQVVDGVRHLRKLPKDLPQAIVDIALGLPTHSLSIVRGNTSGIKPEDTFKLMCLLSEKYVQVVNFELSTVDNKDIYFSYLKRGLDDSHERTSFIFCTPEECEEILEEITSNNFIHRSMLYTFMWLHGEVTKTFTSIIKEAMRVAVITNPRNSVFRIYYNQASPRLTPALSLVNWWSGSLYKSPVLPPAGKVYRDFQGRVFQVPVLHSPPWHFVQYTNSSTGVNVTGGRDHKLLSLMANKLNFRYKYFDPPDRSQGSSISGNGTFKGVLGLIWKRKADFFLGDVTVTWERLQAVEFSFLTLADSGAFLTHAPDKLSETIAVIRPFRWEVWPFLCFTLLVSGPALWLVIAAPSLWRGQGNQLRLLNNCCWFTTTLFLRQSSSKEPSSTFKARLVTVLISLGATYVIGDMYSANLTSLLAKPAKEKPIGTLQALEEAMRDSGYELVVERYSSSLSILQNGTGVYGRLARLMRRQRVQRVRSVEVGVRMVLSKRRVAILGGRETLYYDTERFGSHNFHLSEKLYTRYSAIALQIGCPYLETFNNVVMALFEAGILIKMTTDEYKNLPEHSRKSDPVTESDSHESSDVAESTPSSPTQTESSKGLQPITLTMLRGAFCIIGIGYLLAALVLAIEIKVHRSKKTKTKKESKEKYNFKIMKMHILRQYRRAKVHLYRVIDQALRSEE
ncbi:ionotropic receptor 40a [Aricia agestis]|uniref:ionotropic receptor 40a n=1 Tax=Aricia agestis TaxID=91739 RepID=UPI001C20C2B3|nr:ionotropic receptor 40a [Aricia agestis]